MKQTFAYALAFVKKIATDKAVRHAVTVAAFVVASTVIAAAIDAVNGSSLNPTTVVIVNAVLAGALKKLDAKRDEIQSDSAAPAQ